jgi:hypothetical protein
MSGLTKKIIYADKALSVILGVNEGSLVSYSEISKGIHKYIKEKDLKNPHPVQAQAESPQATFTMPPIQASLAESSPDATVCKDCGETIPADAVFCDMCGVKQ